MEKTVEDLEREEIKKYLLGGMDDARRERFEKRVITDPAYKDAVLMVEDELMEDFLTDGLSESERRDFVKHLLVTPQQRQRLRELRALHDYFRHPSALKAKAVAGGAAPPRLWRRVAGWLWQGGSLFPRAATAVLAIALAAGVFLGARYWLNNPQAHWSVAFRDEWVRLNDPQSPVHQTSSAAPVTLTPTLIRSGSEMTRVVAPAGTETVQVQLRLPPEQHSTYRVTLRPVDAKETFPLPPLPPQTVGGNRVLLLNVPVKLLPRGDYELQLNGVGANDTSIDLDSYNFRLVH
jgi:anti-sigma factor RsiW